MPSQIGDNKRKPKIISYGSPSQTVDSFINNLENLEIENLDFTSKKVLDFVLKVTLCGNTDLLGHLIGMGLDIRRNSKALFRECIKGDNLDLLIYLENQGLDFNGKVIRNGAGFGTQDPNDQALWFACIANAYAIVEHLLNTKSYSDLSLINLSHCSIQIIELMQRFGFDISMSSGEILYGAIEDGNMEVVEFLIECGVKITSDHFIEACGEACDEERGTTLLTARHWDVVRILIKHINHEKIDFFYLIKRAIGVPYTKSMFEFLTSNIPHRTLEDNKLFQLIKSCHSGKPLYILKYLISNNMEFFEKNIDNLIRSQTGSCERIEYILSLGIPYPLERIMYHAHPISLKVLKFLHGLCANIFEGNNFMLRLASGTYNFPIVKYLMEQGADPIQNGPGVIGETFVIKLGKSDQLYDDNNNAIVACIKQDSKDILKYFYEKTTLGDAFWLEMLDLAIQNKAVDSIWFLQSKGYDSSDEYVYKGEQSDEEIGEGESDDEDTDDENSDDDNDDDNDD